MGPHVSQLFDFLRFPSVSTDPVYADQLSQCAQWLFHKFQSIGLEAEVFPTKGHPIVVARSPERPGLKTVLIYGHYDVQPADPLELWSHPPFDPVLEDGRIFARGATDNKGQIFAHIVGVEEAMANDGALPVNVVFLVEGEEEIGSPNLEPFLASHKADLACDVVAVSDTGMVGPGIPTLTYATRGVAGMEIRLRGPSSDLHSGIFGGAVANPATMLARLIATLHDENGRVAVEGFYDRVAPLADWEREQWAALPVGDEQWLALTGAPALFGESGFSTVERVWARPTLEVNGIGGGFQGKGTKTVLPSEAFAKLTVRLVPDQVPEEVLDRVERHVRKHCPPTVTLEIQKGHAGRPYLTDPNGPQGRAAQRALELTFGRKPALTREGGTLPIISSFKEILGADTLLLGLAMPDCRAHAPNENFPLENFLAGTRLNQALLRELAAG